MIRAIQTNRTGNSIDFRDAKSSEYSEKQINTATISVTSYIISFFLNEVHECIDYIDKRYRTHPLCCGGNNGFKNELNQLIAYAEKRRVQELMLADEAKERVRIMSQFVHEDLAKTYMKMYATISNYVSYHGMREPSLFAAVAVAQLVCNCAVANIEKLCDDAAEISPRYKVVKAMAPRQTEKRIIALEDKLAKLLNADKIDCNLDDIKGLNIMLRSFINTIIDIEQIENYCAEGLERTEGAEWLKDNSPATYYLLHPDQDPEYLAEKARREAEYKLAMEEKRQQDELRAKREQQYETAEGWNELLAEKYRVKQ